MFRAVFGEVASEVEVQRSDVVIGDDQNCPCPACWHFGAESRLLLTMYFGDFQDPIAGMFGSFTFSRASQCSWQRTVRRHAERSAIGFG